MSFAQDRVNRVTLDIDDPTVRLRLFSLHSADTIADECPIYPVDHPAFPLPGQSLLMQAQMLGDPPPEPAVGAKKKKIARPNGKWLNALVRSILYREDTILTINGYPVLTLPGVFEDGSPRGSMFGPHRARLMVVGKCLGRKEVEEKMPFCGEFSKDLWRAWDEAGIPRPGHRLSTYMTNLLPYEPPQAVAQQTLSKTLVQDGQHLLWHQFAIARPQYVLLLGSDAAKAVLGRSATVSSFRGKTTTISADFRATPESEPDVWTATVVVADHPAAVARDPDVYPTFLSSVNHLARLLGFQRCPKSVPTDYKSVYTIAELEEAVAESETASAFGGYVAFDCEWEGNHPSDPGSYLYTIQWSHEPGHGRVAFVRRCGGAPNEELLSPRATELFNRLFRRAGERGARLVGHFAKGDLKWMAHAGIDLYDVYVGPRDDGTGANTYVDGGFDTYVSAHAVDEMQSKKIEEMAARDFGVERYDAPIDKWKVDYCKERKIRKSELKGYGNIDEHIIAPYGAADADMAGRLYLRYNGDPRIGTRGLLDRDRFGLSSRKIFGIRMRAWAAMAEMERYGMLVNRDTHRELRDVLWNRYSQILADLRHKIGWPEFDPNKGAHKIDVLFGEEYCKNGKTVMPAAVDGVPCRREYLTPYKATKKYGGKLWPESVRLAKVNGTEKPVPAVDKETLINLSRQSDVVKTLLDLSTIATALKGTFRPPDETDAEDEEEDEDDATEDGETYSKGLMHHLRGDGRISSMLGLVETGRYSSSRPNLQNQSESVDEKINKILMWAEYALSQDSPEAKRKFVSRSIFETQPDWFYADADLKGAEIAAAGWQSDDALLIEHARRNNMDEGDPEWLDLHSDLAMGAFGISCSPAEFKKKYKPLRVGAKRARFGHYYGASPETILRQCLLESPDVTLEQIEQIVRSHDEKYPTLAKYFWGSRKRVRTGWLRNGYGGTRRFRASEQRDLLAGQERAAQNWTCQGLVADHISEALGKMWYFIRDNGMRTRIVLAIHDSIVTESPPDEIEYVADHLLPWAMGYGTPVVVTDFDGRPVPNRAPYYFGVSVKVQQVWGVSMGESWRDKARELCRNKS